MEFLQSTDSDERRQRIAEAAYFRAEKRGFKDGDPIADWIDAEHEVDAELQLREHRRLLEQLESQLATAGKRLGALKKKVSSLTADARKEVEQDVKKLADMRAAFAARLEEIREQGADASHKAKQQAEKLWAEMTASMNRLGARKSKR
jgi:predicted  nucleic acid-binding Zn-ribbon protein